MRFTLILSIFITFLSSLTQAASLCEIQILRTGNSVNNVVIIDELKFDSNMAKTLALSEKTQRALKMFSPQLSRKLTRTLLDEAANHLGLPLEGPQIIDTDQKIKLAQKMLELFKDYFLNREDLNFLVRENYPYNENGDFLEGAAFPNNETAELFAKSDLPIFRKRTRQHIAKEKVRIAKHLGLRWPYYWSYQKIRHYARKIAGTPEKDLVLQELFFESIDPFIKIRMKEIEISNRSTELFTENRSLTKTANGIGRNIFNIYAYTTLPGIGMGLIASQGSGSASGLFFIIPLGITTLIGGYAAALSFIVDAKVNLGLKPLRRELKRLQHETKSNPRIRLLIDQAAHSYYLGVVNEESLNAIQFPDDSLPGLDNSESETLENHLMAIQLYLVNFVLISNQIRDRSYKVANSEIPITQSEAYSGILEIVKGMDEEMLNFWADRLRHLKDLLNTLEMRALNTGEAPLIERISDTRTAIEKLTNILIGRNNDPLQLPFLQIDGLTLEALNNTELEPVSARSL